MPYIEENDLVSLHSQIEEVKEESEKTKKELEDVEYNYTQQTEELNTQKKKTRIQNIFLSILTGIALALAFFFYGQKGSATDVNIDEIKRAEATRLLDSISAVSYNSNTVHSNDNSINTEDHNNITGVSTEQAIADIKQGIKGEKMYSVQIGAFYENRYASLSETLAGISTNEEMFKYSIGLFKTLNKAQKFRLELVKIGFDDAFVASYVNGRRRGIENPN